MTNRRNYIKLAEGIRAAGEVSDVLQNSMFTRAVEHFKHLEDFDTQKFTKHALSSFAINPDRVLKHLAPIAGYEPVLLQREGSDWLYGAYLQDGGDSPYLTRRSLSELAEHRTDEDTHDTWEFDEDDRLLIVGPDSANDFADPDADANIETIAPNEHGLYRIASSAWEVVS